MQEEVINIKLSAICFQKKYLHLNWSVENIQNTAANILIRYSKQMEDESEEDYEHLASVMTSQKEFNTKIRPKRAKFAKVVLKTKESEASTWLRLKR